MSLSYLFLGIPKTFDELVDYAKRRKYHEVDVVVSALDRDCTPPCDFPTTMKTAHLNYDFYVDLIVGGVSFRANTYQHRNAVNTIDLIHINADKIYLYRRSLSDAVVLAEKLERVDLIPSFNGHEMDYARELLKSADISIRRVGDSIRASKAVKKDIMKIQA